MKLAVFSTKPYDKKYLSSVLGAKHAESGIELIFHEFALNEDTVSLVDGADAICVFVNDVVNDNVISALSEFGVKAILLRCAGFNNVDLDAAQRLRIMAVAEFAVALIQTLNRKTHRAYNRVREGNFALDGLLGKTLYGKTVGIVGVGKIGLATARIMKGFGCRLLAYDPFPSPAFEEYGEYKSLEDLLPQCDIVSLHCPLMEQTRHIINRNTLSLMKEGAMLVNTSRGGLLDTESVIHALKTNHIGGLALDVYEAEGELFYNDHSSTIIQDDKLMRLMTFPNVVVCGHQAFFTEEALTEIAECTLSNLEEWIETKTSKNSLTKDLKLRRRESLPVRAI
ncbi:D-isomer specific 2-hydroxyacid dehydrogenase, NAD-binding domain [Fusarium oxysporum f. sp. vasinfectum]|nr:D-isomer specific 2-hydroxyacid dehydrogenase, NAD-binding domain [Fusarium oxysporum f. sp. vasinfectum]KAK2932428.1 D-isomer specific 2-hydroxyacid dehydrogenase, NAD-binding domain [Fusarium oxysporum f. sp. vasinfectum]WKT45900.1 D-isomer specific 2-hydroxyacid dehydrogenase, NAD-binding domain [Fusarium oxysporum f. sp. vasinfectum]